MKNILVVTYHFPPDAEIGAVRPYELARHLPEFGFVPYVLTVEPAFAESPDPGHQPEGVPAHRIVRTIVQTTMRDRVLRAWRTRPAFLENGGRVLGGLSQSAGVSLSERRPTSDLRSWVLRWLAFPDLRYGWYEPALREGDRLMTTTRFDVLFSTSPPRVAHFVASRLAKRHRIPWVMDLRDPWYDTWAESTRPTAFLPVLHDGLFRRHASRAALLVTNTEVHRRHIERTLGPQAPQTACVPNGVHTPSASSSEDRQTPFSIGYFGQMSGRRSAGAFLEGLRRWLDRRPAAAEAVAARFVGVDFEGTRRVAEALRLDRVTFEPRVARKEMPALMAAQYILLVLANDQPLQVPGKVYEYLTAGRRILACTENDSATAGVLAPAQGCYIAEDPESVANALERWWGEYSSGAGAFVERGTLIASMTYRHRAEQLAELLRRVAPCSPV